MNIDRITVKANTWERNAVVQQYYHKDYRLVKEEKITARKVALVFEPIVFKVSPPPSREVRDRYWEVKNEINSISRNSTDDLEYSE